MPSATIVSGCPGTGKTAVAARLAGRSERGVHVASDLFYDFIGNRILQTLPESHDQNATVITAAARAAGAFAFGGYDVFLDGVFGPWFVPLLARELHPVGVNIHYVILYASLEMTLARAASRPDPGREEIVRHMHDRFGKPSSFDRHVVNTTSLTIVETVERIERLLGSGDLRLETAAYTERSSDA